MFIFNNLSTCFEHHYAHLQENKTCVTACVMLRWFCWMWLVAVVGNCSTLTFTVLAPHKAAPHNSYQPHPAEPAQHTTCSNTRLGLLKMGIMMPETCWERIDNKHLTVASFWFSLSLYKYYILRVCVCSFSYPACIAHASYCRLWPVRPHTIFFHVLSSTARFLGEGVGEVIEQKMC